MQRAGDAPFGERFVSLLRASHCSFSILPDDRIQLWVEAIDPLKCVAQELARRDLFSAQGVRRLCGGRERWVKSRAVHVIPQSTA